ncbi:hypothetical protein FC23_GL001231 [Lactobacillus psittaci DSM 15354]|uniref:Uncharacterized protein n=1 Tax=Lactobacillus psittaci DSM 15354 TaxID=1122152 RepID=A0A0R1S998_9LACO|nr:type II toxin-antitoxin system PemK/MazF family toxin [Lactobacillus psittaci]KRL62760.1 hypothetical protein FC23_GL001231 [Lactobacillus psittaci DSM 15354]
MCNSTITKFKKLPYWLNFVSKQYIFEKDKKLPTHYYHFKRGTVIRVNFGINPGSEFSFTHFAIVLDKNDSSRKNTLTVLPLTSKPGINRYCLGKDIFNQTVTLLNSQIKKINDQIPRIQQENLKQEAEILAEDINQISKVAYIYQDFNKSSYVRLTDITTISKLRITKINKFDPSGKIKLTEKQMKDLSLEIAKLYLDKT